MGADAPATPVDAAWVGSVERVEDVRGDVGECANIAAAAGFYHEARCFVLGGTP